MSVGLTPEQLDLSNAVADLLAKRSADTDYDPTVWAEMASMGLVGLVIPEAHGGSGAGFVELGLVMEQLGRALLRAPYLATAVLTPCLLLALADEAEIAEALPRIAAGELITAVAYAETGSARPPRTPSTTATPTPQGWQLTGTKTYVLDAAAAQRFYVQAGTSAGTAIFAVDRGAPGVEVSDLHTIDPSRTQGMLTLTAAAARMIGADGDAQALPQALDCASVALIAEQAGAAMHTMQMATDYAKTRFQFGRAIGSFQAVKHMCADMLLDAESALSAARHVAASYDASHPDFHADLALAQGFCSDAFVTVAATNIQVHGGIGFTWEHPAHLYLRRARTDAQLLGPPAWHRERYVQLREATDD